MIRRNFIPWGVAVILAFQANLRAQTISPSSQTVNYASSAQFTVSVTNASSYQWEFNGNALHDTGPNMSNPGSVSGSATSALALENVTSNMAGTYTVLVNGSANGASATLSIIPGTTLNLTFGGIIGGGPSNVVVQLFDHDKPATVQNFIHYIRSGAWSNMFMQRCQPGFVIQGGSYDTIDRTNTQSPITGLSVDSQFVFATNQNPPFPVAISSEYYVGPHITNDFGTLAVALYPAPGIAGDLGKSDPNSGRDGFYFNLGNNAVLDAANAGPYTVFGRVIGTGTNVLNYFNTLNLSGSGGVSLDSTFSNVFSGSAGAVPGGDLPVNYTSATPAANVNLVYCSIPTNLPFDTNPPTLTITTPLNALFTNGPVIQGTASDDVGLAGVMFTFIPQASDGLTANGGVSITNMVPGGTNFTVTNYDTDLYDDAPDGGSDEADDNGYILPGTYLLIARAQDGAGNLSPAISNLITITSVTTNGNGTVIFANSGPASSPIGYPFQEDGTTYDLRALPAPNTVFLNWTANGSLGYLANIYPEIAVQMQDGELYTATFVTNNAPNLVAVTSPASGSVVGAAPFTMTGTVSSGAVAPVTVTCTIFAVSGGAVQYSPMTTTTASDTWVVNQTNSLLPGSYVLQVYASDSAGHSTVITNSISVAAFKIIGPGSVTLLSGTGALLTNNPADYALQSGSNYEVEAIPAAGSSFVNWTYGDFATASRDLNFGYSGGYLTATFVASNVPKNTKDIITFTSPAASARLHTNNFIIRGKIASSVKTAQITVDIFSATTGAMVDSPLVTSGTNTWEVAVTNIPPDTYIVQAIATNSTGLSQVISEPIYVLEFQEATGTYTGLFLCTNAPVNSTNSGFVTLTVGDSGAFTGKLLFPGSKGVSFSGSNAKFYPNGTFGFGFSGIPGNPFYANFLLDLTNGTETLTGVVASTNAGSWVSQLICYRAATKLTAETSPAKGKYIAGLFPGSDGAGFNTNGYAAVTANAAGTLSVSGALPDGATFAETARPSTNGIWPLYVTPSGYRENGMLLGWETNMGATNFSGQLYWYKRSGVGVYITNGINTNVTTLGTNYVTADEPAAGTYAIVFEGGSLTTLITNTLTVAHTGGPFKTASGAENTNKLNISLSPSGVVTGHFVAPGEQKTLQFKGAYYGGTYGGSGFILGLDGQVGSFLIKPQ